MIKLILLLTALLLINGCSEDDVVVPDSQYTDTIMPLAVDNFWTYADTTYNETNGIEAFSKIGITGYRRITYDNERFFVFLWTGFDMPEDTPRLRSNLVNNEAQGLFYYGQQIDSQTTELNRRLFVKYPAEEGDEWIFTNDTSIRCISVSTPFLTPLGIFDSYVYETASNEGTRFFSSLIGIEETPSLRNNEVTHLYYAPEVGYVGMTRSIDDEITFRRTLIGYYVQEPQEERILRDRIFSP